MKRYLNLDGDSNVETYSIHSSIECMSAVLQEGKPVTHMVEM